MYCNLSKYLGRSKHENHVTSCKTCTSFYLDCAPTPIPTHKYDIKIYPILPKEYGVLCTVIHHCCYFCYLISSLLFKTKSFLTIKNCILKMMNAQWYSIPHTLRSVTQLLNLFYFSLRCPVGVPRCHPFA